MYQENRTKICNNKRKRHNIFAKTLKRIKCFALNSEALTK